MCYITASGYNRMQQITDALNGMTPEMQDLASLNCVEEAVKILKNRGAKMKLIVQTMTVADAVKVMREAGMKSSPDRVMAGIKQGVYPWGDCVVMRSPEYTVYCKMFEQWMKERGETVEPDEGAAGGEGAV